jgi:hypothetical protein
MIYAAEPATLGIFFLLMIVGLVVLIVKPKTRIIGIVIAAIFFGIVLIGAYSWLSISGYDTSSLQTPSRRETIAPPVTAEKSDAVDSDVKKKTKSDLKKNRPKWVDAEPAVIDGVYHTCLCVGPYSSRQECDALLPEELQNAVNRYATRCLDGRTSAKITLADQSLQNEIVKEFWEEPQESSVGPMLNLYARLEFHPAVKEKILALQHQSELNTRLIIACGGVLLVLGLLAGVFTYLKIGGRKTE